MDAINARNGLLLGLLSILLGILFVYLFVEERLGLNYPLFISAALLSGLTLIHLFRKPFGRDRYLLTALAAFFAWMVFIRASALLTVCNIVGSIFFIALALNMKPERHLRSYIARDFLALTLMPFRILMSFFETLPLTNPLRIVMHKDSRLREILRGTLLALLALILFGWLFSAADATFAAVFATLFHFTLPEFIVGRTLLALLVAAFFIGAFGLLCVRTDAPLSRATLSTRTFGFTETTILFGSINLLFFTFIILQIPTLFGDVTYLATEGITYAEYARSGFFQLLWVAIISFVLVLATERKIHLIQERHTLPFKILCSILVIQVVIILASAFWRLSLYESAYGFTTIRLYSHVLMIWLALALTLLAYHIVKSEREEMLLFRLLLTITFFLIGMNALNPDAFIAQKNLTRLEHTGSIDAAYLAALSDDALPHTIHLLFHPDAAIRAAYGMELSYRESRCFVDSCTLLSGNWKGERLPSKEARSLLQHYEVQMLH